jgi:hypothetical protein
LRDELGRFEELRIETTRKINTSVTPFVRFTRVRAAPSSTPAPSRALNPLEPSASGFSPPILVTSTPPTRATRRATRPRRARKRCSICTNTRSTRPRGRHRPSSRVIARAVINPAPLIDVGLGFTRVPMHPRRRDDRAKDGVRERTHRERLHLFDDSVRLRRGEDDGAARGGSRTRGGGLRARGFARARRRSVSRSIRLSVVHRRARAR